MELIAIGLTALLVLVFFALSIRAIRRPAETATAFGLPADGFVRVYGSRNLAIAVIVAALLALRDARGVAVALTCAVPLTLFDMALVGAKARHVVSSVLLVAASALWWSLA
jgi:Domain of unknown function (DUF4267)